MIFLLSLFGATFIPNFTFLAYAYRELQPAAKNDSPSAVQGFKKARPE